MFDNGRCTQKSKLQVELSKDRRRVVIDDWISHYFPTGKIAETYLTHAGYAYLSA
jgi:hypothetical protein